MYYYIHVTRETQLRFWTRTGKWLSEKDHISFYASEVPSSIREYVAYGVGLCGDNQTTIEMTSFESRAWRVECEDGALKLRSSIRPLDLDNDEIERYYAGDKEFFFRELERDAREWRAMRDALNYLDAQKEARS